MNIPAEPSLFPRRYFYTRSTIAVLVLALLFVYELTFVLKLDKAQIDHVKLINSDSTSSTHFIKNTTISAISTAESADADSNSSQPQGTPSISEPDEMHQQQETTKLEEVLPYGDTTIVITTNLIPDHPSIQMINDTIQSCFQHLLGLHPKAPIIITADFVRNGTSVADTARFDGFLRNLLQEYGPRISLLVAPQNRGLNWNMYHAIQFVETEFMYVVQHDMPFCRDIDHTNSIKSLKEYPNDLRIIRFPLYYVEEWIGLWDRKPCFAKPTPVDHVNGLNFTKTGGWSDK